MPGLPSIGPLELIIILVIAVVVLGPGKLPEVGASLGRTLRDFRRAASEVDDAVNLRPLPPEERTEDRGDDASQRSRVTAAAAGDRSFPSEAGVPGASGASPAADAERAR